MQGINIESLQYFVHIILSCRVSILGCGIYDKYNSDIACSLPGVHKLYNKFIAYQIFEIGFDRRQQCLKIDFEDFNETMAILKKSNWVWRTVTFTAAEACGGDGQFLNFSQDSRQSTSQSKTINCYQNCVWQDGDQINSIVVTDFLVLRSRIKANFKI